uniref:HTH CENPB-type domain-containing protein n=1 Tax=Sparus aurata TaxID=8175 RepID=A0A671XB87_SPAAU
MQPGHRDPLEKIMVVNEAERTNNVRAGKRYDVTECNVRRWRSQKDELKNAHSKRRGYRGPQTGRFTEIDRRVCDYEMTEKRNEGMPIPRAVMQQKALEVAPELNIARAEFKASMGWCRRMMRRNGLSLRRRTSLAQRLPADFREKLVNYQRFVIKLRKKHEYPLDQMRNAVQTPVFFDMPTSSHVTVMLTCLADGTKLPPYMILKQKILPRDPITTGIIVRAQEKGWMESRLVVDWLKVVWVRRPGGLRRRRYMLVLDAFHGHVTDEVKKQVKELNGDLVIIPGGMTAAENFLQVLDVVKPSAHLLCEWILQAWADVSSESIINGFKRCCISNLMDGSKDDLMWEDPAAESNNKSASEEEEPSDAEDAAE